MKNTINSSKLNFFDFTLEGLQKYLVEIGAKKFNAQQIYDWVYKKNCFDFNQMSNIAKSTIPPLNKNLDIKLFNVIKTFIDPKDQTTKFLFEIAPGEKIETVLMKFDYGYSVCISSEIGCAMSCKFCASGQLKIVRNSIDNHLLNSII